MSYPYIKDPDFPAVEYTRDKDGEDVVVFWDEPQPGKDKSYPDKRAYVAIPADVLLVVAFKMCVDEIETEWAKRHLESQGYRVEKREPASYGRLAPLVEWCESTQRRLRKGRAG